MLQTGFLQGCDRSSELCGGRVEREDGTARKDMLYIFR